jgi:hypothetical protein
MCVAVIANHIKRGANVAFAQHIQKVRRVGGVWPIIKRHGNHGRRCADGGDRRRIRVMISSGRAIKARAEACVPLNVAAHAPRPAANAWRRERSTI